MNQNDGVDTSAKCKERKCRDRFEDGGEGVEINGFAGEDHLMETRERKMELFTGSIASDQGVIEKGRFTVCNREDIMSIGQLSTRGVRRDELCSNKVIVGSANFYRLTVDLLELLEILSCATEFQK